MKYLYELTLEHKELIISKIKKLCISDAYISSGFKNQDLMFNIVQLLLSTILDSLNNKCWSSEKASFDEGYDKFAQNIDECKVKLLLLGNVEIKQVIAILKLFRKSINDIIFNSIEDKNSIHKYIYLSDSYFDFFELYLYSHWEDADKGDLLIRKIFELTSFGVFIQEGQYITYLNKIGEHICGYNKEELRTMQITDIVHPDYIYVFEHNKTNRDKSKDIFSDRFECKLINKSGKEIWTDISLSELELNGRTCLLGTVIDITDRKNMEEFKLQASENIRMLNEVIELDKIKTEFFSNLSHELRTPLNVILGTLQLVDMYGTQSIDPMIEKSKKYYKIMRQNCYRLLRLVNNWVDLNKLDAGYMHLNLENNDIVSIVSKITASVSDYIENKGLNLEYCSMVDSKTIACDPDKIERIILNLLSNAIKFTDSGGKIFVNVWEEDNKIFISVKDSGIGIPKENQDMIFRRFVQIDKSLSRNHNGSGIGLSLSKSLVELHGGRISLISDVGMGCEFIIELPTNQLTIMEAANNESQYNSNNKIEVINIEFSDIYS